MTLLQRANKLRNDWRGHGGVVGDDEARRRSAVLNELVLELRGLLGSRWEAYPVVLPGRGIFKNGVHRNMVQLVSGVRVPFEQVELDLQPPMEDGVLHVVGPRSGAVCPLLPIVQLAGSPADEWNACYFFNRIDGDQVRFVSYHFEGQPERTECMSRALRGLEELLKPA